MAPVFDYVAVDAAGRRDAGSLDAVHHAAAIQALVERGLHPVTVAPGGAARPGERRASEARPGAGRIPRAQVEGFTYALANLLAAGLPLSQALYTVVRETTHRGARSAWGEVRARVVSGSSLSDALARYPRAFPEVHVAMVRAGEAGGFLEVVLRQIAAFQLTERELKGRVKAALVYPLVLLVLAASVLAFLLTYFIPRFATIFGEFGGELPWLTRAIVAASDLCLRHGPVLVAGAALGGFLLRQALASEEGRRGLDRALLSTPALGVVTARLALVRFARMLGTLLGSGVPLLAALRAARSAVGSPTLTRAVDRAVEEVRRGAPLARSLAREPRLFPPAVIAMVAIAEETGRLDEELVRLAGAYEGELDRRLRMLVALAEPALLFVMAAVIGTVVIGMLLPVFTLQDLIR